MENTCCICFEKKNVYSQMIYQPCRIKTHRICKVCLKKMISTIPISSTKPFIKCQYPFSECQSKNNYKEEIIMKILKDRFFIYKEANSKYLTTDLYTKTCGLCNFVVYIDKTVVKSDALYNPMFRCTNCYTVNCFTCSKVTNYSSCEDCYYYNFYTNPKNFNYFFPKPKSKRDYLTDYKYLNSELEPKYITNFITKMFKNEDLYIMCPVCQTMIEKTEDCNAISHCHTEICIACGMFSNIGEKLEDHWSARGVRGCPRWNSDPCILDNVENYQCVEKECYGHYIGNCTDPSHEQGIMEFKLYKKRKMMKHYIINIPRRIRREVISNLPVYYTKYLPDEEELQLYNVNCDPTEYKHY